MSFVEPRDAAIAWDIVAMMKERQAEAEQARGYFPARVDDAARMPVPTNFPNPGPPGGGP